MRNNKSKISIFSKYFLSILGIVIICCMLVVMWYWEMYGRQKFLFKDVIVLKEDVKKGTIINEDMITFKKFQSSNLIKEPIAKIDEIVGKESKHFIPGNSQLHKVYFDEYKINLDENSFIFKMPDDWILSVPDSIRRKDKIVIYELQFSKFNNLVSNPNTNTNENQDIKIDNIKQYGNAILVTQIAYVKDSSNKEIVDIGNEDRLDGSSNIASIEIVITKEQLEILKESYKAGNKFIILYED